MTHEVDRPSLPSSVSAPELGIGTWDWSLRDDVFSSTEENSRLCGLDPDEAFDYERWMDRINPADRDDVDRAVREALSGAGHYDIEYRVRVPESQPRWLWAKGTVDFEADGSPLRLHGVHIDITARKQPELELETTEAELRRTNELKDDFLAMLGHELRNPIGAIANGVELMRSEKAQEHREWAIDMIDRQTRQLKRLVDDILEVSRVARGQLEIRPEIVSLAACIEAARDAVRERLQDNDREIVVRIPRERIYLFADPARMEQILGNLLSNAVKYTEQRGRIELAAERDGEKVQIHVRDDGEGISEEHLKVVFEPFVRVSRSLRRAGSGLGIGLTLVKRLVELHGGTVTARSTGQGSGSTFTVELPVHDGEPDSDAEAPGRRLPALRILVIDDNRDLAVGLKKRLETQGHDVTLAHDGPQGIAAARDAKPDVVLVDIGLPSLDGYQVAEIVRAESSGALQVAGISGFKERGEEEVASDVFDHYFLKPVEPEQLNAWLSRVATELDAMGEGHGRA